MSMSAFLLFLFGKLLRRSSKCGSRALSCDLQQRLGYPGVRSDRRKSDGLNKSVRGT
jgi:hypothetical protein